MWKKHSGVTIDVNHDHQLASLLKGNVDIGTYVVSRVQSISISIHTNMYLFSSFPASQYMNTKGRFMAQPTMFSDKYFGAQHDEIKPTFVALHR